MDKRRFTVFAAIVAVLMTVAVLTQVSITPAPAQMAPPNVTGKITDTIIKSFGPTGLPGIHSIQYRRARWSPGAKIEGSFVVDDHAELCEPKRGSATITLEDGTKVVFKPGAILTVPLGTKAKLAVADAKLGFEEFYWSINIKERK